MGERLSPRREPELYPGERASVGPDPVPVHVEEVVGGPDPEPFVSENRLSLGRHETYSLDEEQRVVDEAEVGSFTGGWLSEARCPTLEGWREVVAGLDPDSL